MSPNHQGVSNNHSASAIARAFSPETTAVLQPGTEPEVSIVVPCLNEAETLEVCITKAFDSLRRLQVAGEVIIADNGSTDQTRAIAHTTGDGRTQGQR